MIGNSNCRAIGSTCEILTGTVMGGVVDNYTLQIPCTKMPRYIDIRRTVQDSNTGVQTLCIGQSVGGVYSVKSTGVSTSGRLIGLNDPNGNTSDASFADGILTIQISSSDSTYAFYAKEYTYELVIV